MFNRVFHYFHHPFLGLNLAGGLWRWGGVMLRWRSFRRALNSEAWKRSGLVYPFYLIRPEMPKQSDGFWCLPVRKQQKVRPFFFSCFMLPNKHSKRLVPAAQDHFLTDSQAEKTEKADREIRSPEPKPGSQKQNYWFSHVFTWKMVWNLCSIFTNEVQPCSCSSRLSGLFCKIWCLFSFMIQAPVPMARRSSSGS